MKKVFSVFLAVIMALSVFAVAAFAEDIDLTGYVEVHASPEGLSDGEYYAVDNLLAFMNYMIGNSSGFIVKFYYNPTTGDCAYNMSSTTITYSSTNSMGTTYASDVRQVGDDPVAVKQGEYEHGDYYVTMESFGRALYGDAYEEELDIIPSLYEAYSDFTIYPSSGLITLIFNGSLRSYRPVDDSYPVFRAMILLAHDLGDYTYTDETHSRACTAEGCDYVETASHAWVEGETVATTCTENGSVAYACVCGAEKSEAIPAAGHTWDEGEVTTPPTCTEAGVRTFHCTVCEDGEKTEPEAALGHLWSNWTVTKEATEKEKGEKERHCTREGCDEVETAEIPVNVVKVSFFQKIIQFFKNIFSKIGNLFKGKKK